MAEKSETLLEKIADKIHAPDESSSSSDSDDEKRKSSDTSSKSKYHLFGREKPIDQVLGGGKQAALFLWRNKKASSAVLGGASVIWVLFELMDYHLLTLLCHALILMMAFLFLWFNASKFMNKSPPQIPQISIPEDLALNIARFLILEINRSLAELQEIALGRDFKKFFAVISGLWVLSIIGSFFSLLTLSYIGFVLLHTAPLVYEKHQDKIDSICEKAMEEIKKQYAVLEAKVLNIILRKDKRQ